MIPTGPSSQSVTDVIKTYENDKSFDGAIVKRKVIEFLDKNRQLLPLAEQKNILSLVNGLFHNHQICEKLKDAVNAAAAFIQNKNNCCANTEGLQKRFEPKIKTAKEANFPIVPKARQSSNVASGLSLLDLERIVTDNTFDKHPKRKEILDSYRKKFNEKNESVNKIVEYYSNLLSSNKTAEQVFKIFDFTVANSFACYAIQKSAGFASRFIDLIFENPKFAHQLLNKYPVIEKFSFGDQLGKKLFQLSTEGFDFKANQDLIICLAKLQIARLEAAHFLIWINLPTRNFFNILEAIADDCILEAILKGHVYNNKITEKLIQFIFENPGQAFQFLDNPKHIKILEFNFKNENFERAFERAISIGIDKDIDRDFSACLEMLMLIPTINKKFYDSLFLSVIQCDIPLTFKVLSRNRKINLFSLFKFDSVECFKRLFVMFPDRYEFFSIEAIKYEAPKCLRFLVDEINKKIKIDQKLDKLDKLIKCLKSKADINLFLAIFQDNEENAADLLFSFFMLSKDIFKNPAPYQKLIEKEIRHFLYKLLKKNEIELVDRIVAHLQKDSQYGELIAKFYPKIKEDFLEIGPYLAQYSKSYQIQIVRHSYSRNKPSDPIGEEIEHGFSCRSHAGRLLKEAQNLNLEPTKEEFLKFPPSSTGTRRVAGLVEKYCEIRAKRQEERSGTLLNENEDNKIIKFKSIRRAGWKTPIAGNYDFAGPIVKAVSQFSNAPDLQFGSFKNVIIESQLSEFLASMNFLYKGQVINNVTLHTNKNEVLVKNKQIKDPKQKMEENLYWYHGRLPIETTWKDIEDTFEELMAFSFKKPSDNKPCSIEKYEKQLFEFYARASKLVWLIGNTQPLCRGSGTLAEWLLAIVHLQHGIKPPILKNEFPQLDVLDISFPLSDYQRLFTYFFRPSTLPMKTNWPKNVSSEPVFAQLKRCYQLTRST